MSAVGTTGITTDDQTNVEERRAKGEFVRGVSTARNWISPRSISDDDNQNAIQYLPSPNRYHLYVAYNCPWCHRVLLARSLLGLQDVITVDVVFPNRSSQEDERGPNLWQFAPDGIKTMNGRFTKFPECTNDTVCNNQKYIKDIYVLAGIDNEKSVPILFDKQTMTIVNNESSDIVRMLATEMKQFSKYNEDQELDLYPSHLEKEINEWNDYIYVNINNGSYKAGFSSNQDVYEEAYKNYFNALGRLDNVFGDKKFLTGNNVTEADLRLFPTLYRHDPIYHNRFKLNQSFLWESKYSNIWRWMNDMMKLNGMDEVSNSNYLTHCKQGYFGRTGNGTIPIGPKGYPECYKIPNF